MPRSGKGRGRGAVVVLGLGVFALAITMVFGLIWWRFRQRLRRVAPWACGFAGARTPRMQDSPAGFVQPLARLFGALRPAGTVPSAAFGTIRDPFGDWLYRPVAHTAQWVGRQVALLQQGRIGLYLLYAFVTLIALLAVLR